MPADEIIAAIKKAIPDAKIELEDLVGDQDHWACLVKSEQFAGLTRIQQHKRVYDALGSKLGGELHALSLKTSTP